MLKVTFSYDLKQLNIQFDVPMPLAVQDHAEWKDFVDKINSFNEVKFVEKENFIGGLIIDLGMWLNFVKDVASEKEFNFQGKMFEQIFSQEKKELGDGLKVNFHQRSFDTNERYWNFVFNQGNFIDYFINRLKWYLCPKYTIVAPFPLHVDLESASTCNMNCPMCYRDLLKEVGQMDMDLFKKAIDECAVNNVFSIRLSWRGETLTHPKIKEMVAYSTKKIKNVSFLTNAFFLTEDMVDCFVDNGVSYVAVSFDGINETYEKVRHPAKFQENYQRLATFKERRDKKGKAMPQIRACTIWPAISRDPDKYYDTMKKVTDYIVCNPYINFKGPMKIKPDFICQYPWERIVIAFNGKAQCCTGWNTDDIILGNVKERNIYDMWHNDLMNKIRDIHANSKRMELHSCAECRHGSRGDPNVKIDDIIKRRY